MKRRRARAGAKKPTALTVRERVAAMVPAILSQIETALQREPEPEALPRFVECVTPLIRLSSQLADFEAQSASSDQRSSDQDRVLLEALLARQGIEPEPFDAAVSRLTHEQTFEVERLRAMVARLGGNPDADA